MNYRHIARAALFGAGALLAGAPAPGASAAEQAADQVEETVVTARRREEDVQDVPAVVSVFDGERLFTSGTDSMERLRDQVPNLYFASDMSYRTRVSVRGLGSDRSGAQTNGVGFFIDGVYQNGTTRFSQPFFDIERIEVLKGPQGARYGRNAFAGVVNVVTRKPDDTFRTSVQAGAENYGTYSYGAMVSGALLPGQIFGKLSGAHNQSHGDYESDMTGRDVAESHSDFYDARLVWMASERLEFDAKYTRASNDGPTFPFTQVESVQDLSERFGIRDDQTSGADYDDYVLATTWSGDSFTVIGHVSRYDYFVHTRVDGDVGPNNGIVQQVGIDGTQDDYELRVQSAGPGEWTWMFGAEYVKNDFDQDFETFFLPGIDVALTGLPRAVLDSLLTAGVIPAPAPGLTYTQLFNGLEATPATNTIQGDSENWAVFGEVSYLWNERVELVASARYDDIRKDVFNTAAGLTGSGLGKRFEDRQLQPLFSVRWSVDDLTSLYASAARGIREGGFNPASLTKAYAVFDSDEVWNYEVGMKRNLPDIDGHLNVAFFYADADVLNQFSPILADAGNLANGAITLGGARSYGADIEFAMRINDNLAWNMGAAYLHCRLEDIPDRASLPADFSLIAGGVKSGANCPDSSEWSFSGTLDAEYPIGADGLTATGSLNMGFKGPTTIQLDELSRSRQETQDPVYLFNVSAGVRTEHITVLAYVNNVTNQRYATDATSADTIRKAGLLGAPDGYTVVLAPKRHYGVRLRYEF